MIRITLTPIAVMAALLAPARCIKPAERQAASAEPTAPDSEWVTESSSEPAVPLNLSNSSTTGAASPKVSPPATNATPTTRLGLAGRPAFPKAAGPPYHVPRAMPGREHGDPPGEETFRRGQARAGGMVSLPALLLIALATINATAFAAFAIDKTQAMTGTRRTPEATLLLLAALGGTPGAFAARALLRHKTRKRPFIGRFHAIAIAQLLALAALWLMR